MGIKFVKNFNLVLKIGHKRKGDSVTSKGGRAWWSKQVTTVGVGSKKGEKVVLAVVLGKREAGNNKLFNHMSDFQRNSTIRIMCMETPSLMAILNGLGQLATTCP